MRCYTECTYAQATNSYRESGRYIGKLQPLRGRERAFEGLKNGQEDVVETPEKETKAR